ncbi:MAG: histidine--tRNA ligase [SAR324 cluster bacterium]|nr:histidine--tRNA ligase [SAR324 cluster bacterium]
MIDLQPVKGTRDFFPDDMRLRNWLFNLWRETAAMFGFEEYDSCVLESEELYIRKAGDEISDQLYNFEDKGGRKLSLRPEMTPTLARMIISQQKALSFPIKWFSVAQCFRYERMTKGRRREHFQWNMDIVGQDHIVAEAELLSALIKACSSMGLTTEHIRIFINDRRILNAILTNLSVADDQHPAILVILDKKDKLRPEDFRQLLKEASLSEDQISRLEEYLSTSDLHQLGEKLGENEGILNLKKLLSTMEMSGLAAYFQFDITIVRGLSYYTGTVFEMNTPSKNQRAICGGGRYDSLLSTYGGDVISSVGFGFGDVVILDMLKELNLLPQLGKKLDYMIVPFSWDEASLALKIANALTARGSKVECNFSMKKMKKVLQQANDLNVSKVLFLFPEELQKQQIVVKDMKTHDQQVLPLLAFLPSYSRGA